MNESSIEGSGHAKSVPKYFPIIAGIFAHATIFSAIPKSRFAPPKWLRQFIVGIAEGVTDLRHSIAIPGGIATACALGRFLRISEVKQLEIANKTSDAVRPVSSEFLQTPGTRRWLEISNQNQISDQISR